MKDLCLCISAIAIVEIPTGSWDDFIEMMANQGNQNESQFFKMAGIYNLGLIQDILVPSDLKETDINLIWNTMLNNIKSQNLDLTRIVAKSFARLAPATETNFKVEDQK